MRNKTLDVRCCISPGGLSGEEQWVGFEGHGAVCGGWSFGKDQFDQHIQTTVVRKAIFAA